VNLREKQKLSKIKAVIHIYRKILIEHLERTPENRTQKLLYQYEPKVRICQGRQTKMGRRILILLTETDQNPWCRILSSLLQHRVNESRIWI